MMAFKCKSVNISYAHVIFLGELGRVGDFLPLVILGIVVNSPSFGYGVSPMTRFPCLVSVMTLYWFRRRQHKIILWSSSEMNVFPLLYFFSSGVSPRRRSCYI